MDRLPDELLLRIFDLVEVGPRIALGRVNSRWLQLIGRSCEDQRILAMSDVRCPESSSCPRPFQRALAICGSYVRELRLDARGRFLDSDTVRAIIENCPPEKLRVLRWEGIVADPRDVRSLLSHFNDLDTVITDGLDGTRLLASLRGDTTRLRVLEIQNGGAISSVDFDRATIAGLVELRLVRCRILRGTLPAMIDGPNLRLLDVSNSSLEHVGDLAEVCRRAPNLRRLNLTDMELRRSDDHHGDLWTAVGELKNLRWLGLPDIVDDEIVARLPRTLTTLSVRNSRSVSDLGLLRLAAFSQLTLLDVSGLTRINDWALSQLACAGLPRLVRLFCCECTNLTGSFLLAAVSNCPRLDAVGVRGCTGVRDACLEPCLETLFARPRPLTLFVEDSGLTVAFLVVNNQQYRGARLRYDTSPCSQHGHIR